MASVRTLHSGNLVRGICAGDRKLFMEKYYGIRNLFCQRRYSLKGWWMGGRKMNQKTQQEGYRNFNLKSLTEEEERFIKKLVDAEIPILARGELLDFKGRGQRRKLQLYGERES